MAAIGTAGYLFWKSKNIHDSYTHGLHILKAENSGAEPALSTTQNRSPDEFRTPTVENGHTRDVIASEPPAPDSGSNFGVQGQVHGPDKTENKPEE